jgi:prepilin-type N-terminal cleavage/methylation domain-containing protein/prepilin-type processing-associated H-X9-DG protein
MAVQAVGQADGRRCLHVSHSKRGFTLIELLVVIAIIAILAAVLFPVFLSVKAKALQAQCLSNLKQIGMATSMYIDQSNSRYAPYCYTNPATGVKSGGWFALMQKYSRTKLLAKCPALASNFQSSAAAKKATVSYWSNSYLNYWCGWPGYTTAPPMETAVRLRQSTVYLQDGPPSESALGYTMDAQHNWWGPPHAWSMSQDCLDAERRHNGGANVLFCDWHVKLVKPEEFQTSVTGTGSSDPLIAVKWPAGAGWNEKGDGHPWYRAD